MPPSMAGRRDPQDAPSEAVRLFSETAEQFHGYYRDNAEFHERLEVWGELLDRYAPPSGLSLDMGCGSGVFWTAVARTGLGGCGDRLDPPLIW